MSVESKKLEKEVKPTEPSLIEVVQSVNFQKALQLSATKTQETGYETGFDVYIEEGSRIIIPRVVLGGTDNIGYFSGVKILKNIDNKEISKDIPRYIALHFHPDEFVEFSSEDLYPFLPEASNIPNYLIVGSVNDIGDVKLLCCQYPGYNLSRADIEIYEDTPAIRYGDNAAVEQLETLGLKAEMIYLRKSGQSQTKYIVKSTNNEK